MPRILERALAIEGEACLQPRRGASCHWARRDRRHRCSGVALLGDHPDTVTWGGLVYNLFWVSLGNIVAGAGIMALGYWTMSRPADAPSPAGLQAAAD